MNFFSKSNVFSLFSTTCSTEISKKNNASRIKEYLVKSLAGGLFLCLPFFFDAQKTSHCTSDKHFKCNIVKIIENNVKNRFLCFDGLHAILK